jgi:hypothetical protein
MSPEILNLPAELLQNKSLTSNQKLILSLTSTQTEMFSLEIAKSLGTRRSNIQHDLEALVEQGYLASSNGSGRVSYSLQDGTYVITQPFDQAKPVQYRALKKGSNTLRSKVSYINNNNSRRELSKIIINNNTNRAREHSVRAGSAESAYMYWLNSGGRKHRETSESYKTTMGMLEKLFLGKAFEFVVPQVIPNPILNKVKIFTLDDFKTSLDNYLLSVNSPAHQPANKTMALKFRKKLALSNFIYSTWGKEGRTRSMFLQYLEPPKLICIEQSRYEKITKALTKAFGTVPLSLPPHQPAIIAAANKYGDLIKKHKWRYQSYPEVARYFIEFVETKNLSNFSTNWLSVNWFYVDLEKFLDRKGLISLTG